jgi:hypothetical protein
VCYEAPTQITASKKIAVQKIGSTLHEFKITFGPDSQFTGEAIELACVYNSTSTSTYLKRIGLIIIDGANFAELEKCK